MRRNNKVNPWEAKRIARQKYAERQIDKFVKWSWSMRGKVKYRDIVELQKKYGCIIVLKGHGTIICNKQNAYLCSSGGPELAVAGSGDILSGVIVSLIAQGLKPWHAAITGVGIHAQAGEAFANDVGQIGLAASEIIAYIRTQLN